jgi:hypothetical protein
MAGDDWTAIHDHMPGKDMTLTVRGTTELGSPGYTNVRLEPAAPQGTNRLILMLEVKADAPTGAQPDVMTPYEVEYREGTEIEYESVSISPDGVSVEVQHVH